jgi:hypothetical protein
MLTLLKKVIFVLIIGVILVLFLRFVIGGDEDTWICDKSKGEWVKHGNPSAQKPEGGCGDKVILSITPANSCKSQSGKIMLIDTAKEIAMENCKEGELKETYFCNDFTGTWWIDFAPDKPKEGCNPACVIDIEKGTAEINWRCTGLINPKD